MSALRNRLLYWSTVLGLLVMLFFSSKRFLLYMAGSMVVLALTVGILLRYDSRLVSVFLDVDRKHRSDRDLRLSLTVHSTGFFLAAKYIVAEIEVVNTMFGSSSTRTVLMPLRKSALSFEVGIPMDFCGETIVRCKGIKICDMLELFNIALPPFPEMRTTVYPERRNVSLAIGKNVLSSSYSGSAMQNKRGSDPSEIFDIRAYAPGDNIRSIHWKLSGKLDDLYIKEASEPSHYDIALMPDLGCSRGDTPVSRDMLSCAVALTIAIGEQLLDDGIMFCMLTPTDQGLASAGVRNAHEFSRALQKWLSTQIPSEANSGIDFFLNERSEKLYSRLFVVSAEELSPRLTTLSSDIATLAVCAADVKAPVYTQLSHSCTSAVIPYIDSTDSCYRIVC